VLGGRLSEKCGLGPEAGTMAQVMLQPSPPPSGPATQNQSTLSSKMVVQEHIPHKYLELVHTLT
jgi:hypothetical protein